MNARFVSFIFLLSAQRLKEGGWALLRDGVGRENGVVGGNFPQNFTLRTDEPSFLPISANVHGFAML